MAFVIKFVKGVRNHWKKSTFAVIAITYGVNYTKEHYETQNLMRHYCLKAASYGRQPISPGDTPRQITVILNPNANKRKALKDFEKYCAPILNLAGICVNIIQTESEGHAKTLIENLGTTDAVIAAGGDGTLSEVITGLLRKTGDKLELPVGVLPLGRTNTIASHLFPGTEHLRKVTSLADASLAIVEHFTKPVDVMKIQVIDDEDDSGKPVYALSSIEWGAYRDADVKKDKYWYFGPLRNYATYLFNGYKNSLSWNCEASVNYTLPCEGCRGCVTRSDDLNVRWYHKFITRKPPQPIVKEANPLCLEIHKKEISTLDLKLSTTNTSNNIGDLPTLHLNVGPNSVDYVNFVSQGWKSVRGQTRSISELVEMKQVDILPVKKGDDKMFSIDREEFEVKPVKVTLLSNAVKMFCKPNVFM